jgi:Holliday junction resolvasome RuvABC ATP-dependent DNA helicase subunit
MSKKPETLFPEIVGQTKAKRKLAFFINGYRASNLIPHIMFVAPKGCGKTMLAKALGRNLNSRGSTKHKRFLEINCSTIKNVRQFFNQIIIPHVHNQECTILFDEASELPKDVTMALLTILNPNESNRTTFTFEDYTVDFDFSQQSFMFATTEAQQIFHALMDRCERVDLEEYKFSELAKIVGRTLKGAKFQGDVLDKVASVLRGNARQAQKMANNIRIYLKSKRRKSFTLNDWRILKYELGILPLGLSPIELQILNVLLEAKECSLTKISAKTGLSKACVQRDFEIYLQKNSLMEISTAGRSLTKKGMDYLKNLEEAA